MSKSGKPGAMHRIRSNMLANIIGAIVILMVLFGVLSSIVGLISFTDAFKRDYSQTTYHMAETAAILVNGDRIDDYLEGKETEEYVKTQQYLEVYCKKIHVSLVYVIAVDRSDYGRFVSVFNAVDNTVDNTTYTEWELGYERDTTNDEYRRKYEALYNKEVPYETIYRTNTTGGVHPHVTTLVPVTGSDGSVAALLCIQRPIRELYDARRPYLITIAVTTAALAIMASLSAALFIRKRFVKPIRKIAAEATRFAKENTVGEHLEGISNLNELSKLSVSIDTMEKDMLKYVENLTRATAEKERMSTELSLASTIQINSIPNVFPPFPDRSEFDIYASMDPAREVGGDFYNFFLTDDDHIAMVIGDVSGKGIPAALFMMVTNILISDRTYMGGTPSEILSFVNKNICEHNSADMFVTVWLGILEISTGKLIASNAGHEYPAVMKNGSGFELIKDRHGLVIGGMPGAKYTDYEITLEPGDKLFVYTDGVPEATDAAKELFGAERMTAALNSDTGACPEQILKNVRAAVDGFVKDAEQFDDLTMLCIEYKGKKGEKENGK